MQSRSIPKMVLLTFITLGFYQLYWLYQTSQEMVRKGLRIPNFLLLVLPLLTIVIASFVFVVARFVFSTVDGGSNYSFLEIIFLFVGVISYILIIPIALYWFYKYCKAVESVTDGLFQFDMDYFMLILLSLFGLSFVWPFVVQSYFNRIPLSNINPIY